MLSDYFTQTFQRFNRPQSTPSDPSPSDENVGSTFKGTLVNKTGSLPLQGNKLTVNSEMKVMCDVGQEVNDTEWIRHVDTGHEYKIIRINADTGVYGVSSNNAHKSIYLEVNK